jgi:hypothetical protein
MKGIFAKLYRLKSKTALEPLEDYLTEIIAHCLKENPALWAAFLRRISSKLPEELIELSTQVNYQALEDHKTGSKPDIIAFTETKAFFIENKVGSYEGVDQLKRYAAHLSNQKKDEKYLVYITRDYDPKSPEEIGIKELDIVFIQLRWYQISQVFSKFRTEPLVKELLHFMNQHKLTMTNQFTPTDIVALKNFEKVKKMMEEVIGGEVERAFRKFVGASQKMTYSNLHFHEHGRFILHQEMNHGMWVGLGFWLRSEEEDEYPKVKVQLEISPNSMMRDEANEIFEEILRTDGFHEWKAYNLDNPRAWSGINYYVSLQDIMSDREHIERLQAILLEEIDLLVKAKEMYPELPWK